MKPVKLYSLTMQGNQMSYQPLAVILTSLVVDYGITITKEQGKLYANMAVFDSIDSSPTLGALRYNLRRVK